MRKELESLIVELDLLDSNNGISYSVINRMLLNLDLDSLGAGSDVGAMALNRVLAGIESKHTASR